MPRILKDLKIIFAGTPFLAKEILARLLDSEIKVLSVITQPDKPVGRSQIFQSPQVKQYARKKGLIIKQFKKLDQEAIEFVQSQKPDLIILVAYGLLLPKKLLEIPTLGSVNIHPSLLPKFRGPSPIQAALLAGERVSGVSIMLMDEKMDSGPILSQKQIKIDQNNSYSDLEKKVIEVSGKLLVQTLEKWINNEIDPTPQDDKLATYTKIITKKDGAIDWDRPSGEIHNQYRAFSVWPKIHSTWTEGGKQKRITFNTIGHNALFTHKKTPGEVFRNDSEILIATGQGVIIPTIIQLEGKKKMHIKDFLNGKPNFIGSVLE